jgi:hypothetical protein
MKNMMIYTITALSIFFSACSQTRLMNSISPEEPIAFPGAEGFGKYTTGGRGGKMYIVSNLNDSGEGSFRKAAEKKEPRIIVFAVSGTIHLQTKLNIAGNATIAGQTAPGDGICLADQPVVLNGDNIIVRFLRFRMGDKFQNKGMVAGSGSDDAFGAMKRKNIIVDHCSLSWSTDEVFSVYAGDSTTLQWNLISEPLNYSYHFETGDKDFERHGYGAIWGGRHLTAHHNLFAHCNSRTPRFDGIRNAPEENVDYRNNVIYNWGGNNVYAGEGGNYNIVNNYYQPGPSTSKKSNSQIVNPFKKDPTIPFGKFYIEGNFLEGNPDINKNNWYGVVLNDGNESDKENAKLNSPIGSVAVTTQSAIDAYKSVLQYAGAIAPVRDTLDQRVIEDVRKGRGKFIDVQGGYPHGTPYEQTVNAWPALKSLPAPVDTDKDGMPDEFEKNNNLNINDASDAPKNSLHKHYTNIEMYINSIIQK